MATRGAVLILENEYLIAGLLAEWVTAAGCTVVGPVATVATAHALINDHGIDAAFLDVQLDGNERSFELAACLQAMRVPFAFITGYSRPSWPLAFQRVPFFSKPLVSEDVSNLLSQLLPPPGGHT